MISVALWLILGVLFLFDKEISWFYRILIFSLLATIAAKHLQIMQMN